MEPVAYFLPGVRGFEVASAEFGLDAVRLRTPEVTPELVSSIVEQITAARDRHLALQPVSRVVEVIDATIGRWLDPSYALRQQAERLLPMVSGYSPEMVRTGLPQLLKPFRANGLRDLVGGELGDPPALDTGATAGRRSLVGPRLTTHVLSGNMPAVAAETIIHALLVKSASLVKASSEDPVFPVLFAQSLAEIDPDTAASVAVLWWKGGQADIEARALGVSDAIVAYGSDQAVAEVRGKAHPSTRLVAYPPRMGFALVGRDALAKGGLEALAERAAWDVAFFDQQGCVSPHAIVVERGGDITPFEFAEAVARQLGMLEQRMPRGRLRPDEAAAIQWFRAAAEMRAASGRGGGLFQSKGSTAWTVAYEEGVPLSVSPLNRTVTVLPADDLAALQSWLAPFRNVLQTVGVALSAERLDQLAPGLARAGVTRICPIGRMQHPPASWGHDGRPVLLDLVHWLDVGF